MTSSLHGIRRVERTTVAVPKSLRAARWRAAVILITKSLHKNADHIRKVTKGGAMPFIKVSGNGLTPKVFIEMPNDGDHR